MTKDKVTLSQFEAIQKIYDYFNTKLFGGELGQCILNFSRKSKAHGFFAPERWGRVGEKTKDIHEISLNPESLNRDQITVISTLVHEMAHLWQADHGTPSPGYHNKEWAAKMEEIGLIPTDTGAPGGKKTGRNMTHYIEEGGAYEKYYNLMPDAYLYPFSCVQESARAKKAKAAKKNKIKYSCPSCGANAWGKPDLLITCGECEEAFEVAE